MLHTLRKLFAAIKLNHRGRASHAGRPGLEMLEDRSLMSGTQFNTSEWARWVTNPKMHVLTGDFNGDGRTDVMKFDVRSNGNQGSNGLWVGLSNGSGFDTSQWANWVTSEKTKVLAGDFNGDGRTDVMKFDVRSNGDQATMGLWVGLSNGSGFDTSQWASWVTSEKTKVLAGDFNGDGRTDVMKFDVRSNGSQGTNGLWVGLSNGSGFDTSQWASWVTNEKTKVLAGDFNGDGRTDVMKFDVRSNGDQGSNGLWVGLSNGSGFDTSQWASWVTSEQTKVLAGDFNGDGRTDVMKFDVRSNGDQGSNGLWVGLSNGSGFDTSQWASWVTSEQTKVLSGDFNGDGRTDVMKFDVRSNGDSGAGGLWVGLSTGSGFSTSQWSSWITSEPIKVLGGDFNGDRRTDVMKFDVGSGQGTGGLWVGLANNIPLELGRLNAPASWSAGESGNSASITISGGSFLYSNLSVTGLPPGLSARLIDDKVVISGTPTRAGTFAVISVSLRDSRGVTFRATYSLTISLGVSPASLPGATAGNSYRTSFQAVGGSGRYSYSLASGSLPSGLSLSSAGVLSGTTTSAGQFRFTVRATDNAQSGVAGTRTYTLTVAPARASTVRLSTSTTETVTGGGVTVTIEVTDRFGNRAAHTGNVTISSSNSAVFAALRVSVSNGVGSGTLIARRSGSARISATVGGIQSNGITITVNPSLYDYSYLLTARFTNGAMLTRIFNGTFPNDAAAEARAASEAGGWQWDLARQYRDAGVSVTSRLQSRRAAN